MANIQVDKIGCSDLKIDKLAIIEIPDEHTSNIMNKRNGSVIQNVIDRKKVRCNKNKNKVKFVQMSGELNDHNNAVCTNSTVDFCMQKISENNGRRNKKIKFVRPKEEKHKGHPKPECNIKVLIGLSLKNSEIWSLVLDEIYEFVQTNFPFYRFTRIRWRHSIRQCLNMNEYFIIDNRVPKRCDPKLKSPASLSWTINPKHSFELDNMIQEWAYKDKNVTMKTMAQPEYIFKLIDNQNFNLNINIPDDLQKILDNPIEFLNISHNLHDNLKEINESDLNILINELDTQAFTSNNNIAPVYKSSENPCINNDKFENLKTDLTHIKRPLNPFMVWAAAERRKIVAQNPRIYHPTISKKLGLMWKQLTDREQLPFFIESARLKEIHRKIYPNYKYCPQRKKRHFVQGPSSFTN